MMKTIQEGDITFINIYDPNILYMHIYILHIYKYIKQIFTDIKRKIGNNKIIVREFNNPLTSRQKFNKETLALNDTLDQIDLIDIYKTFHPKPAEYNFFSNAHETLSRTDHRLIHKTSLNKF